MFDEKSVTKLRWRVAFICTAISILSLPNCVSAYATYHVTTFDKSTYGSGSTGIVNISVTSFDEASQVSSAIVTLIFNRADGQIERLVAGQNYDSDPLYIPAGNTVKLSYSFQVPASAISGYFYYISKLGIRRYGETSYDNFVSEPSIAQVTGGGSCSVDNPSYSSYSDLKYDYDVLLQNYQSLQSSQTTSRTQLTLFQGLTVVFVISTLMLLGLTISFAVRRPRVKTT